MAMTDTSYTMVYESTKTKEGSKPRYVVVDNRSLSDVRRIAIAKINRNTVKKVEDTRLRGKLPDGLFAIKVSKGNEMWTETEGYVLKRGQDYIWATPKGMRMVYRHLRKDGTIDHSRRVNAKGLRTVSMKTKEAQASATKLARVASTFTSVANVITIMSIL